MRDWMHRQLGVVFVLFLAVIATAAHKARAETAGQPSRPETTSSIAERALKSVVLVVTRDSDGYPLAIGSGFVVKDGIVATCHHLVDGAHSGFVKSVGKSGQSAIKGLVASDAYRDLILLKVPELKASPLPLAQGVEPTVGEEIYVAGNPLGLEGTFSEGIISGIRKVEDESLIQLTAPVSSGSSGSAVLNRQGEVIGVAAAVVKGGQNLNFAVPAFHLARLIERAHDVEPLSKIAEAKEDRESLLQQHESEVAEGLVTYRFELKGWARFSFVVKNNLRRPVKNVCWLVVVYDERGRPLDFDSGKNAYLTIPPGLAKPIGGKIDDDIAGAVENADVRILSFEVIREHKPLDELLFE